MKYLSLIIIFSIILNFNGFSQSKLPPIDVTKNEPVKYIGKLQTDKHYYDGRLRHAVGIHSRQILRANRIDSPLGELTGWTYNHAPMLCYWNGRFYVQYLSNLKEEHHPPGRTLLITSKDGIQWSPPKVLFPIYLLPKINAEHGLIKEGTPAVVHQRMGFYVAPNGKLLTVSFVSYSETPRDSPNRGQGLGRLVREIKKNGTFGPIYFIRYNRSKGWNEKTVPHYKFFKTSNDTGFVNACNALLSDKLMTLQWWEMDRTKDGFYTIDPGKYETKALCYYHRPDNVVVAIWKYSLTALSPDNGLHWTKIEKSKTLETCGAKVWGQKTDDGKYSLVYDHSATHRNRFPLVIITGKDGYRFNNMLCVSGEVPPIRYQGIHKSIGLQYIRGILEGNGNPPGNDEWITYSVNKEDIWVSKIHIPVIGLVKQNVNQNFENLRTVEDLTYWNLYMPQWAPITISEAPSNFANHCLNLKDEEPYNYAKAERAFPESKKFSVEFDVYLKKVGTAKLEIEIQDSAGSRPMRLRLDNEWLMFDRGKIEKVRPVAIHTQKWYHIKMDFNCFTSSYDCYLQNKLVRKNIPFNNQVKNLERIVFRTGPWRGDVRQFIVNGVPGNPGLYIEDLPGSGYKTAESEYLIDNVKTNGL